jgi:hypothetical protein
MLCRPDLQIAGAQHLGFVRQLHRDQRLSGPAPATVTAR